MFIIKHVLVIILCLCPLWTFAAECPDGYSIIDDSGLCKVQCPDGYRVENVGENCKPVVYATGVVNGPYYVRHKVVYGEVSGPDGERYCPKPADGQMVVVDSGVQASLRACFAWNILERYTTEDGDSLPSITHGVVRAPCYYTTGDDGNAIYDKRTIDPVTGEIRNGCMGGTTAISCDAGYYAHCTRVGHGAYDMPCQPVGYNYYSPDGDLKRYACPSGTMTCGYGDCADSIDDCVPYKTLHIGEDATLVMGVAKYMSPSLAVRDSDGNVYYAQSTTVNVSTPHLRFMGDDGVKYTIINPLEQFGTTVYSYGDYDYVNCENNETTYTHINIP